MYIFDTCSLKELFDHFDRNVFPTLWERFDSLVVSREIISVREVLKELEQKADMLSKWAKENRDIFEPPSKNEQKVLEEIFNDYNYNDMLTKSKLLSGKPYADPFLIAKAKVRKGILVTQEVNKQNSVKIPSICEKLSIECCNFTDFLKREKLMF